MTIQGVPDLGPGLRLHLNENTGGCSPKVVEAVRAFDGTHLATYRTFARRFTRRPRIWARIPIASS